MSILVLDINNRITDKPDDFGGFVVVFNMLNQADFQGRFFVSDFLPCVQNKYAQFVHNPALKNAGVYGIIGM